MGGRASWFVVGLAILLRLALFPFADNKHGDAPMRALIAERMVIDPASAAQPRTYCQFGPLHTTLMRPFIALDRDAARSSRYLSLLAGIGVFFPFLALARRLVGRARAPLAALALAVSPLHLQASTTAASEALYLLLWVAALERLLAALERNRLRTFVVAGLLASLAAVTRYDAWLALPLVAVAAALLWSGGPATDGAARSWRHLPIAGLALFSGAAAVFPVAWLIFSARAGGDALFFAHYISADHAGLAATALARYGPVLGRLRQIGVWALAFCAAMTPPAAFLAVAGLARGPGWRGLPAPMRLVVVAALGPPAIYILQGLVLQSFEPLPRFALVPGALLLPLAVAGVPAASARRLGISCAASAAALSIVLWTVAVAGRDRIWPGPESMGALTRLDREDRALAAHLRAHRPPGAPVMIQPFAFADIGIEQAAGVPWTEAVSLISTRTPQATVAETMRATGARIIAGYDQPGGWPRTLPDWPKDDLRFGRWRVVTAGD